METELRRLADLTTEDVRNLINGRPVESVSVPSDYPDAVSYLTDVLFASPLKDRKRFGKRIIPLFSVLFQDRSLRGKGEQEFSLLQIATASAFDRRDLPLVINFLKQMLLDKKFLGWPSKEADCHRQSLFALGIHARELLKHKDICDQVSSDLETDQYAAAAFGVVAANDAKWTLRVFQKVLKRLASQALPINSILLTAAQSVASSKENVANAEKQIRELKNLVLREEDLTQFREFVEKSQRLHNS